MTLPWNNTLEIGQAGVERKSISRK